MASSAGSIKRVTLELGGNDAAIVLDDVEPAVAARKVFDGTMINAGQVRVAIKRAYVPKSMEDAFCVELLPLSEQAEVADGMSQSATMAQAHQAVPARKVKDQTKTAG